MLEYAAIEEMVTVDFNTFDFADKPMEKYCGYHRDKHIKMTVQLTINAFTGKKTYLISEVEDFIHGLNHVFFNGVGAGQCFEWSKEREKNEG